jgi:zinc protease
VQDFKTEAGAVKGEYTKGSASPYFQLNEKISETAFNTHTYGHTTMGYFKDVVDMPNQYDYSLEFFKRFYRPEYATIIVVGDVQPAEVNALAQKYFGQWKRGNYVPKIPAEPTQTSTRYTHIQMAGFPPLLSLNYKAPAFSDTKIDMPALDILSTILFSEKGELYKKLVLNEQKVRFIRGGATDSRDPNLFSINASVVKAADLQYVKDEIVKTLDAAKTNKVDAQILADTKSRLRNSFAMSIDNATSIAESLSHYVWLTGDPESLNKFYAMYEKVTAEDLMNVAKKYFISTALTVATISPSATIDVK